MNDYVILTDSGCDIGKERLQEWKVPQIYLTYQFDGDSKSYTPAEMETKAFYEKMRGGAVARTAAANVSDFQEAFIPYLQQGKDILYIGFSGGLSSTVATAAMTAADLMEEYPGTSIRVVDTLAASSGHGLLLYYAVEAKKEGKSLNENADYIESIKLKLCHWFTVDDLVYLKRGGRVSAATALAGTVLGIKPVLHVDNEGHLINMSKSRGRKNSLKALADKYTETADQPEGGIYFISNGDCLEDALYLESLIEARHGTKAAQIEDIGPVIGAHSGPGTIALFFLGKER